MTRRRTSILISGRGSNMMALVEAARTPDFPAEIAAVISNRPDAAGLAWAHAQGRAGVESAIGTLTKNVAQDDQPLVRLTAAQTLVALDARQSASIIWKVICSPRCWRRG